jgi:hypothetical protein
VHAKGAGGGGRPAQSNQIKTVNQTIKQSFQSNNHINQSKKENKETNKQASKQTNTRIKIFEQGGAG